MKKLINMNVHEKIVDLIQSGKTVCVGYCAEETLDSKVLAFKSEQDAIKLYTLNGATAYKYSVVDGGLCLLKVVDLYK